MVVFQDRVPTYPGRVKMTPVSGQENIYDLTRADNPVVEGTKLNKVFFDSIQPQIGDIKVTTRTDLGDNWLLCNGEVVDGAKYPELASLVPADVSKEWAGLKTFELNQTHCSKIRKVNGLYIFTSYNRIYYANDINGEWNYFVPNSTMTYIIDIVYGNGYWVIKARTSSSGNNYYFWYATDLLGSWAQSNNSCNYKASDLIFDGSEFLYAQDDYSSSYYYIYLYRFTSPAGTVNSVKLPSYSSSNDRAYSALAYINGRYIIASDLNGDSDYSFCYWYSTDKTNWKGYKTTSSPYRGIPSTISYFDGKYIFVCNQGTYWTASLGGAVTGSIESTANCNRFGIVYKDNFLLMKERPDSGSYMTLNVYGAGTSTTTAPTQLSITNFSNTPIYAFNGNVAMYADDTGVYVVGSIGLDYQTGKMTIFSPAPKLPAITLDGAYAYIKAKED